VKSTPPAPESGSVVALERLVYNGETVEPGTEFVVDPRFRDAMLEQHLIEKV